MSESPTSRAAETEPSGPATAEPTASAQGVGEPEPAAAADETALDPPTDPATTGRTPKPTRRSPKPYGVAVLTLAVIGISVGVYLTLSSSPEGLSPAADISSKVVSTTPAGGATATGGLAVPGPMPSAPATHGASATHGAPATHSASATHGASATHSAPATHETAAKPNSPTKQQNKPQPLTPSHPGQVKSWNAGPAGAALSRVTSDAGTVLMAHGVGQYSQMLQACKALSGSVKAAEALPPIPDAAMQRAYVKSLATFDSGIAECLAGITLHPKGGETTITSLNQADIGQVIKHFDLGMTELYVATESLRKQ